VSVSWREDTRVPACAQAAFPRPKERRSAAWRTGGLDAFRSEPTAEMKGRSHGLGGLPGSGGARVSATASEEGTSVNWMHPVISLDGPGD